MIISFKQDFGFLASCPVPGLLIQGDNDEVVKHHAVARLAEKLQQQRGIVIDYKLISDADHFFTGKLAELTQYVDSYLTQKSLTPARVINR